MFIDKAINQLDDELKGFMAAAELFVADMPGPEVVVDGIDPRTMVLVDAMLLGPDDEEEDVQVVPEQVSVRVFLYAVNLMRAAAGLHGVQQTVHDALQTELSATITELREELDEELLLDEELARDEQERAKLA